MYNTSIMRHRVVQKSLARRAIFRVPDLRNCESRVLCGDEARRVADDILALLLTVSPPTRSTLPRTRPREAACVSSFTTGTDTRRR